MCWETMYLDFWITTLLSIDNRYMIEHLSMRTNGCNVNLAINISNKQKAPGHEYHQSSTSASAGTKAPEKTSSAIKKH